MTKESLQENYINCTKQLKYQRVWDYFQIVLHIVFTVCIVTSYVKAIGNGTDYVASKFILYSVISAVYGFCFYATVSSINDIKVINRGLKLFDDVHQSAIEALEATEREKDKTDDDAVPKGTGKMTISEEIETAQNCAEDAK